MLPPFSKGIYLFLLLNFKFLFLEEPKSFLWQNLTQIFGGAFDIPYLDQWLIEKAEKEARSRALDHQM